MGKKQPNTTNTQIRNVLRRLFLYSRERRRCLKGAICPCGSKIKLEAHHLKPIDWDRVFAVLRDEILTDNLTPLCKKCHDKITYKRV
jgi:5-methylcytosine-specific restriction endonuclease McrA